jgi:tetratricopeptide (TPR) repeat protein
LKFAVARAGFSVQKEKRTVMALDAKTEKPGSNFQTAIFPAAMAALAAAGLAIGGVAVAQWQPGQPGNYVELIQQKLAPVVGVPGADAIPLDEADRALRRGNALLAARQPGEAIKEFERAVALQPAYALAWVNMGVVYYSLNRPREAREAFLHGYTLDPYSFLAAHNLALLNDLEGHLHVARDFYQQAARLDPNNAEVKKRLKSLKTLDR